MIYKAKSQIPSLSFVMDGFVETFRKNFDGWDSPLSILKKGNVICPAGVLNNKSSYFGVRAASEHVTLVSFSKENAQKILADYPFVALNLISALEDTAASYSFLWLNSDK